MYRREHHFRRWVQILDLVCRFEAAYPSRSQVDHHEVRQKLTCHRKRFLRVACFADNAETLLGLKELDKIRAVPVIVVCNEDSDKVPFSFDVLFGIAGTLPF